MKVILIFIIFCQLFTIKGLESRELSDMLNDMRLISNDGIKPGCIGEGGQDDFSPLISRDDIKCIFGNTWGYSQFNKRKKYLNKILDETLPALNKSLRKFQITHKENELSMFLSQLIHESGFFQYTTEIGNYRYYTQDEKAVRKKLYSGNWEQDNFCNTHKKASEGGKNYFDKMRRRFACFMIKSYNKKRRIDRGLKNIKIEKNYDDGYLLESSMRMSSYPSRWRGRGFIQLTHCINYLLYAQFVAFYNYCTKSKKSDDCVAYAHKKSKNKFIIEEKGKKKVEISFRAKLQCSEAQLKTIITDFNNKNPGLNLDQGKILTDPYNMSNMCRPQHLTDSAAWYWKKGYRSCSELATGKKSYNIKKNASICRCNLDKKRGSWNAKYVKDSNGNVIYDKNNEPKKGKCVYQRKKGRCGKKREIARNVTKEEQIRIAGSTRCINGAYCRGLDHRTMLYRNIRDYFKMNKKQKDLVCERFTRN